MKEERILKIEGTLIDKSQLESHLQKIASNHSLTNKSKKETYPIPQLLENYKTIRSVYNLLNEHLKLGINIHPAGEWLLDNFYIIEQTVKQIQKDLPLKKYVNFLGIANGKYQGFARIYVLASEIVAYTDNKIESRDLEDYLASYQTKKSLSMEEIWNIGIFLQIAIIENIREVCEKIYNSQIEKLKAESIAERLIENKAKTDLVFSMQNVKSLKKDVFNDMKYSFIEYMSYILRRYGKKGYSYLKVLEETVEMTGTTVQEVIKKEHFDIAVRKVSIGNSITSIKNIQRINFLEIFERVNGVEEILKEDPADVYSRMDNETKEIYRNRIKEISKKTKISEIYIARKILEIAKKEEKGTKQSHIGYYLIDKGIDKTYKELQYPKRNSINDNTKQKLYIAFSIIFSILISIGISSLLNMYIKNVAVYVLSILIFLIPSSELAIQLIQYILSKIVKPKPIPKLDFYNGIDKENTTMVIIPTILKSREKVKELMRKLEVFYIANKSENIYFTLLGDCSESDFEEESFDAEVIEEGINDVQRLNEKYSKKDEFPIFNFLYRKRQWNEKEGTYLGWERKRGMINQFNEYVLKNMKKNGGKNDSEIDDDKYSFKVNTIEDFKDKLPEIKYVITLDADTDLILNLAFELIGAMAHILNKPVVDKDKNIVTEGHALIQPRIGINLDVSYKTIFTKLFAGAGGIDSYTNAISDTYQDNFNEGIFTGKGIYDLSVFSQVLKDVIPENTVLSHDLLEGSYLRCGLATDILLMDGYPCKYNSFMNRLSRWIRGDWQIFKWMTSKVNTKNGKVKNPLSSLSKFKIFDNLRRSLFEISIIISILYLAILGVVFKLKIYPLVLTILLISVIPYVLQILNNLIFKKEGEKKQKTFTPKISGYKGIIIRMIITLGCLPYKAYVAFIAISKTIYRKLITHRNLLEWMTSEEAEKQAKSDSFSYFKQMYINVIAGIIVIMYSSYVKNIFGILFGILWVITPYVMCYISKVNKKGLSLKRKVNKMGQSPKSQKGKDPKSQSYVDEIGKRTWGFFKEYLTKENNYLITDNYQNDRREKIIDRTSSTNIGLSVLAVISSYDLNYAKLDETICLLNNMLISIDGLQKWNGHLYNWYNIKTKEPLMPRYVSTVDSGNFVGYMYVTRSFLESVGKEEISVELKNKIDNSLQIVNKLIDNTDFTHLYDYEHQIFSIGYNIEENKLTDSYYDLLASEARQASFVAIAKKDIPSKHWNSLSRTLTVLGKYKGLISWSGTAFEYLMPNINMPKYKGSLLDESCKFMIMSQIKYANEFNLPWGISESAFNLKDLHSNYQYKAFGIPWLGLKRGLADEMVVSSYGSILAICDVPEEVIDNLKRLEKFGMFGKYGFYESIDFTPERVEKGKKASVVKTYMAHHQGLILLSINNYFNDNILQKRFMDNPEIEATSILLQETMPEKSIITKEDKEKVEKLKYKDYENYIENTYTKIDEKIVRGNVISNENYTIAINQEGKGISKYNDIYVNRFKKTEDYSQGIIFNIKNIKSKNVMSSIYSQNDEDKNNYQISFMPDKTVQEIKSGNIKVKIETTIASNEPVEIRRVKIENVGNEDELLEVTGYFEPVLSKKEQDCAHPVFNNLFLVYDYDEKTNSIVLKRKSREQNGEEIYLATTLSANNGEVIGDLEYEIEEEKFIGRGNLGIPNMVINSIPFSKRMGLVTEPVVALKRTIKIKPQDNGYIDLILSVGDNKESVLENLEKYKLSENVKNTFELSKARVEAESRYLRIKGKDIDIYQKILSYIIFDNPIKNLTAEKRNKREYSQSDLWKYGISGDLPIILVKIQNVNDVYCIKEVLRAYEFFRTKNIQTEIVILDEEKYSYENYLREEIDASILNNQMAYLKNVNGGIFILNKEEVDNKDVELLEFISTIVIDTAKGGLANNLKELEEEYLEKYKEISEEQKDNNIIELNDETENIDILSNKENLKYYNEYGAFSEDGKEYLIKLDKKNRLPTVWAHILANEKFGTVVTESMGGYSWYKNSRLNRVTAWENNPSYDVPSEIIYFKDLETKKTWSLGLNPMPDNQVYNVVYGFGYCKYIHKSMGIEQEYEIFVPKEDSCKIGILRLKNTTPNRKKLKLYYYIKPVIGEDEIKTGENINIKFDRNNNIITARNLFTNEISGTKVYVSSSEKIKSYTGDKKFFLGNKGLSNPAGLRKVSLNNENSVGRSSCIAIELEVEIESFSDKEISLILGADDNLIDCKNIAYKYSKIQNCKQELDIVKNYWKELLGRLQVYTPLESTNILLNGWLAYQVIESRLIGKSGYYQSGGAYGYRDQLQDTIGIKYIKPEALKNQIIKHSKHQFIEGDVEHWWHDETGRGIRTRFSDDLLWLPYLVLEYIKMTGDKSILSIETLYLKGELLEEGQDERYDKYIESEEKGTIYEHCIKAIEKSLNFGEHGLPKIGSGDWNDGFSTVGNKGKGESVWLGFFLYKILDGFIEIGDVENEIKNVGKQDISNDIENGNNVDDKIDGFEIVENNNFENLETEKDDDKDDEKTEDVIKETRIEKYKRLKMELKKALNTAGWDGRWYKRAFMDDGNVLGSMENDECRIDSIAQSWSIISNAGDNDKKYISIESLENHLVDKENGIIKLLDPPFEKSKLEPGYIKAYLPGVRENGGQYTHSSCWVIIAEALLGFGDKALEFYRMINPIEHARTKDACNKYKVEPYSIAADIYGASNLAGRGGWTWYTGSASWYYNAGIEYILGLKIEDGFLKFNPCIPKEWKEFLIKYRWKDSLYNIKVSNVNGKNSGVECVKVNGEEVENCIKLDGGNRIYNVEVIM